MEHKPWIILSAACAVSLLALMWLVPPTAGLPVVIVWYLLVGIGIFSGGRWLQLRLGSQQGVSVVVIATVSLLVLLGLSTLGQLTLIDLLLVGVFAGALFLGWKLLLIDR